MTRYGLFPAAERLARRRSLQALALSAVLLPILGAGGGQIAFPSESGQQQQQPRPGQAGRNPMGPPDATGPLSAHNLEHMREQERRKRLLSDTARLVELTNELKTEVEASSKDELSLDVVRKAAQIEKLAHDVKERMKS